MPSQCWMMILSKVVLVTLLLGAGHGFSTTTPATTTVAEKQRLHWGATRSTAVTLPKPLVATTATTRTPFPQNTRRQGISTLLASSLNDDEEKEEEAPAAAKEEETPNKTENDDDEATTTKIEKRKKRVVIGYQTVMFMYLAAAVFHVLRKGIVFWSLYYACGGPLLAAGVAYVLKDAATANRLSSDTYKRLNLSLGVVGILGLSLPILDPTHFKTLSFVLPPLIALVNSIKGYGYGVLGVDKKKTDIQAVMKDFKAGIASTAKGYFQFQKKSLDYILALAMVTGLTLVKAKECIEVATSATSSPLALASRVSRLSRLFLLTSVVYTLKDAADRDRLSGTTFIELNYLSSLVFFTMGGYMCPVWKPTLLGVAAFAFSGITGWNGYSKAQAKKNA